MIGWTLQFPLDQDAFSQLREDVMCILMILAAFAWPERETSITNNSACPSFSFLFCMFFTETSSMDENRLEWRYY